MKRKPPASVFRCGILVMLFVVPGLVSIEAQQEVQIYKEDVVFPTYPIHEPDVNPMFFKGESYQGASKMIYPYPLIDNLSNDRVEKAWTGLFLENEYIRACVTPEIGGKLYWAEDKSNGYNFFYKNNAVKPANIGMLGAWVSGGIEWNVLHHHRASTYMPLANTMVENEDGSKTIWVGENEPRHRMRWILGLTAFPGKSYLEAEVKIMNPTPHTHSFLYWANVSTHANKDYQVYFPPSADFGTDHSKVDFTHWPISREAYRGEESYNSSVDMGRWINHPSPVSIFCHELNEDFMGGYDHGKEVGTVHVANHQVVRGAKLFEWGPSDLGQMWDKVLTEKDGPYIEIMVGAWSDNQPDYSWIRPHEIKVHKQYWYPVKDIGGILYANLNGAVNLEVKDNNRAFFGFSVTQAFPEASVVMTVSGQTVFEEKVDIDPAKAWTGEVKIPKETEPADIRVALVSGEGEELVAYQPVKKEYKEALPPVVSPPGDPATYESVEELYLAGLRLVQFYNPVLDPTPYFEEALKRDPGNSAVHTIMGKQALMKGKYDRAAGHFRSAIARLSKDYTRPENCEAYYGLGQVLKFRESWNDAVDTLYRATWDYAFHSPGYYSLAEISCIRGDYRLALEQVDLSLSTNAKDLAALNLKAGIHRQRGEYEQTIETARLVLDEDPLNLRAAWEQNLASKAIGRQDRVLEDLEAGLYGDHEDYLELAVAYLNCGMYADGTSVLEHFRDEIAEGGIDPMVYYYLGYLNERLGNGDLAGDFYRKAASLPTDLCFPFRFESEKIFNAALKSNPADAKAWYYLGNLLYDKQPQVAMTHWTKAVKVDPELAIAHRNLGWGTYRANRDIPQAIAHYEAALEIKKDDPIYFYELDRLYELNGTDPQVRLAMLEPNHENVKKRNDSFLREIMVLNLTGKYEKAVDYLSNNHFHIREGDMKIRDINVDAHLLLGLQYMHGNQPEKALEQFNLANTFPDNQQVGRTMNDERVSQIHYYIASVYKMLGKKKDAAAHFLASVEQDIGTSEFSYFQGLSYLEMEEVENARNTFESLIKGGEGILEGGVRKDVFAKFGETETEESHRSDAHLKIGLGYLGMKKMQQAKEHLERSVDLDASNQWASVMLDEMENRVAGVQ